MKGEFEMNFFDIFNQVLVLFILILVGYIVTKKGMLSPHGTRDLSILVLYVTLPAMIIRSMQFDFSPELLLSSGKMAMIAGFVYAFAIFLSYALTHILGFKGKQRDVLQAAMIFPNVGFMGYPVVNAIYGAEGVFFASLFNIPFDIVMWTVGIHLMRRHGDSKETTYKNPLFIFLNPGTIAVTIGFILFAFSIKLPGPIDSTLAYLASATTPVAMITVGSILSRTEVYSIFKNSSLLITAFIKMILIPAVLYFALRLFNMQGYFLAIPVLITAMPVAANVAIFAVKYENDSNTASQAVFLTTLMSVLTIPIIAVLI